MNKIRHFIEAIFIPVPKDRKMMCDLKRIDPMSYYIYKGILK